MEPTETPPVELPFPTRHHPEVEKIEAHTRDWAVRLHLAQSDAATENLARSSYGDLAAYIYPLAPLPEANLAADWLAWLCFADDQYEEGTHGSEQEWGAVTEAVRAVLEPGHVAGPLTRTPLIRALADLSRRLDLLASPVWKKRFTGHFLDSMAAAMREIQLREEGTPPPLSEYIGLRRDCGAVLPSLDLIEVCAHVELPPEVYHSTAYQEIVLAGTDIISWTNDLYSLDKEIAHGIVTNLVLVLQHQRGLDRPRAFRAAHSLIDRRVADLLAAQQRLPALAESLRLDAATRMALHRCAEGVRDWVAGSNRWHATASRFQQHTADRETCPIEDLLVPERSDREDQQISIFSG